MNGTVYPITTTPHNTSKKSANRKGRDEDGDEEEEEEEYSTRGIFLRSTPIDVMVDCIAFASKIISTNDLTLGASVHGAFEVGLGCFGLFVFSSIADSSPASSEPRLIST